MKIVSIEFDKYKVFDSGPSDSGLQRLDIAPLTVLFGKNNSGKSAVARLPLLLLGGLACDDGRILPMEVSGQSFGANFLDIAPGGDFFGKPRFKIHATSVIGELKVDVSLYIAGAFSVEDPPGIWSYSMLSPVRLDIAVPRVRHGPVEEFRGLLPSNPAFDSWRAEAKSLIDSMVHIGPLRSPIASAYSNELFGDFDSRGEAAPQLLRTDNSLAELVGAWYQENLDGWRLSLQRDSASFALRISRSARHSANLSLSGEGLQQVLPVVTHQYWRQLRGEGDFLDIVEQPELHLHPAAQAPLADLFIDTATKTEGCTIVETNSEGFLLRLQRRVAEGVMDPDRLRLYFVKPMEDHSELSGVKIEANGDLDWWPEGVFEEDFREVAAIRRAQRAALIEGRSK
ncbi:MAG: hypothetical protein R3F08_05745 [Dokdonella sp.]|nr:hypothetical protein [Dokdonella sp.]